MILGIETSSEQCAVALVEDGRCVAERSAPGQRQQSARLLPMVDELLKQVGRLGSGLEGLAVSQGPGSFTGLRVGMSLAKGLALGWKKPLVGVRTLLVLAHQAVEGLRVSNSPFDIRHSQLVCSLIDAKRGEVYVEWFERHGVEVRSLRAGLCGTPEAVKRGWEDLRGRSAESPPVVFIGDGLAVSDETWKSFTKATITPREWWVPKASTVARLAEKMIRSADVPSFAELAPLYLREPPISRPSFPASER